MTKIKLFTVSFFIFLFALPLSALALGQMSEPINITNAMRGQQIHQELIAVNNDDNQITVVFSADGQIKDWTKFYKPGDLKNPIATTTIAAKTNLTMIAVFSIPNDAPNGEYKGTVSVSNVPEPNAQTNQSSASVRQKIDREVTIKISDVENISLNVSVIPKTYDLVVNQPLSIRIIYDNQGNVAIKPDLQLKISRDGQPVYNVIFPYPENEEAVRPQEIKELSAPIEWATTGQTDGKYQADIKVLVNNQTIKEDGFGFSIGAVNVSAKGLFAAVTAIGRGNLTLGWFIIGGLLLLIAAFLAIIARRKKLAKF